jgi:hypothetical protein
MHRIIPIRENARGCLKAVETEARRRAHVTANAKLQLHYALVAACLMFHEHSDHCTCGATAMPMPEAA